MKKLNALYIGCTLAMAGFLPAAHAANMSKDVCHTQKSTIETGHAKDVCTTQAKAEHEKSLAALSLQKNVQNAQKDASEQVREADYKVAAEKCDVYAGDAKSNCIIAAKKFYGMN